MLQSSFGCSCILLCCLDRKPFPTVELPVPDLLRPSAASSVTPAFPPLVTSLSSFPSAGCTLPMSYTTRPPTQWRMQYPPQMPSQFELHQRFIKPPVPPPAPTTLSFAVPTRTEPSSNVNSLQMVSNSSAVASGASQNVPQSSAAGDSTSSLSLSSIDAELLKWAADFPNCLDAGQVDLGLTEYGLWDDILNEPLADTDSSANDVVAAAATAAGLQFTATNHSQIETTNPGQVDAVNADLMNLMSELQRLNEFGTQM